MALKRLNKDLKEIKDGSYTHFSATPKVTKEFAEDGSTVDVMNMFQWDAVIFGPAGTPYEGGIFKIRIDIPSEYPFKPPMFKFLTKVYHPNIGVTGLICLDILKTQWSPALGLTKSLLSIVSLLAEPNPTDPFNADAGHMYLTNKAAFDTIAREWTDQYAK